VHWLNRKEAFERGVPWYLQHFGRDPKCGATPDGARQSPSAPAPSGQAGLHAPRRTRGSGRVARSRRGRARGPLATIRGRDSHVPPLAGRGGAAQCLGPGHPKVARVPHAPRAPRAGGARAGAEQRAAGGRAQLRFVVVLREPVRAPQPPCPAGGGVAPLCARPTIVRTLDHCAHDLCRWPGSSRGSTTWRRSARAPRAARSPRLRRSRRACGARSPAEGATGAASRRACTCPPSPARRGGPACAEAARPMARTRRGAPAGAEAA
jgi:hypothetical protein